MNLFHVYSKLTSTDIQDKKLTPQSYHSKEKGNIFFFFCKKRNNFTHKCDSMFH